MIFNRIIAISAIIAGANAAVSSILGKVHEKTVPNSYLIETASAEKTLSEIKALGFNFVVKNTINTKFFAGVSLEIKEDHDESVIAALPSAVTINRIHYVAAPKPVSVAASEELKWAPEGIHSITGVNDARNKLGLTGKGIKVAVVDTGIDYHHLALGSGSFGPGNKIAFGYDLVGDEYGSANGYVPNPDADPFDPCEAHGTHVAGIVGADARNITAPEWVTDVPFTGVAPEVTLGAYRVFGCGGGGTQTDVMAAAIYMAAEDGADIINLSIGGGPAFADDASAVAATRVSAAGHFVFGSNGNDGATGIFVGGSPAAAEAGFGVASFDNYETPKPYLNAVGESFEFNIGGNNGNFDLTKEYEVIAADLTADDTDKQDDGGNPIPVNATGKALLVRWGNTAFGGSSKRCTNAANARAVACILYANTDSVPNIAGSPLIPSLATTHIAGKAILAQLKAGKKATILVTDKVKNFKLPTAGTVSDFSSPGLDQELQIKPDFGGIGGQVYSTITKAGQGSSKQPYAVYSGTSMSSPYSAGVAALVLQAYGRQNVDFDTLRTILQNTATPSKKYGTDLFDSVAYQGAGLVNAYKAATAKTIVYPSRIALNDTQYTKQHYKLTVTNKNTVAVNYAVKHQPALQVNPFKAGDDATLTAVDQTYTADFATVKFSKNNDRVDSLEFTLKAGESKSFNVHVQPPSNAVAGLFPVYSGYVVVDIEGEKVASVPYAGVVGNWRDAQVFSRKSASFDANLQQAKSALAEYLIPVAKNATLSTGIYSYFGGFLPIKENEVLNLAVDGSFIAPIAATTSRYARVEAVYKGNDWSALKAAGIKRTDSLVLLPDVVLPLQPNAATGSLDIAGGYPLNFNTFQRASYSQGQGTVKPNIFFWTGYAVRNVSDASSVVYLPEGPYQIKFTALKHFGRTNAPVAGKDFDTVYTPTFTISYAV
ncbi:hypothetical protein HDU97_004435 [Phlyctochytrium planicorne]|nr:hypothetical protein HDU97_004435 [Phlyctochytrium planicorne]